MPAPTHFLTGAELDESRLDLLLHRAAALKEKPRSSRALEGRTVALLFQQPSTRTRVSFETGVFELGGHHGGTSCSSATSHSQPASAAANSSSSERPTESGLRPW